MTTEQHTNERELRDAIAHIIGYCDGTPDLDKHQWTELRELVIEVADQASVYFDSPALAWNLTPIKDTA